MCARIAGWGAFLQGACQEDDFLGEYTGDLITQVRKGRRDHWQACSGQPARSWSLTSRNT